MEKLFKEDYTMAEFSASDALLTQAMSGGVGNGTWNNRNDRRDWSDAGPIRADVLSNREIGATGIENIERSIMTGFTRDLIVNGNDKICNNINNSTNRMSDNQFRSELRASDQHAAIVAQMNASDKEQAKCCCEQKLQAANYHAEVMAKMEALSKETVAHERDLAERELMAIKYAPRPHGGGHPS